MKWVLLSVIVFATVFSDLLQSYEMKRSGEQTVVVDPYLLLFLLPAAYQLTAITAALIHLSNRRPPLPRTHGVELPCVSVLKPLRGLDPNTEEAFLSQIAQNYPQFEILFGVR